MTYTADTPIVGQGQATAAQIDELFRQVAAKSDEHFTSPPPGLGQTFINWCKAYDHTVNHDLVAAQSCHETGGWTSWWASEDEKEKRLNPAGIGVDGVPGHGEKFDSVGDGVMCQVAHLLDYAVGLGPWTPDDRRAKAMPQAWAGTCPLWRDLNGKWAYPGTTYAQQVAVLANRLLTIEGPMTAQVDGFAWVPETCGEYGYPTGTHGRNGRAIDRFIVHYTAGTDSLAYLTGCHQNSVHFLTNRDGTPRAQMIPLEDAAWGAGNQEYNLRGVNFEIERTAEEANSWPNDLIEKAAESAARILKHPLCAGITTDRTHIIGHAEVPDQDHTDPGGFFPWPLFIDRVRFYRGESTPTPPTPKLILPGQPDGFGFVLGFKAWVEQIGTCRFPADPSSGALSIVGYAKEDEWAGTDGCSYQRCERGVLQYNPKNNLPFDVVVMQRNAKLPGKAKT